MALRDCLDPARPSFGISISSHYRRSPRHLLSAGGVGTRWSVAWVLYLSGYRHSDREAPTERCGRACRNLSHGLDLVNCIVHSGAERSGNRSRGPMGIALVPEQWSALVAFADPLRPRRQRRISPSGACEIAYSEWFPRHSALSIQSTGASGIFPGPLSLETVPGRDLEQRAAAPSPDDSAVAARGGLRRSNRSRRTFQFVHI